MTDKKISFPLEQEYDDFYENENYLAEPCLNRIYEESHLSFLKLDEHKSFSFENDIDPDANFYKDWNPGSKYYTENLFNELSLDGFSIIHFNSRSLYANFDQIKENLQSLKHSFQVIAISETWLTNEKGSNFILEGYNHFSVNRKTKRGGGVAFFVQKDFQCRVVDSTVVDDIMESLTIEIHSTNLKSTIVSCIYRTPGSCIDSFVNSMVDILGKVCDKKQVFVCGDFNIDLMKWNEHKMTTEFCNTMFSLGIWPLIDKPSRITKESATLLDNIFTNTHHQLSICS